MNYILLVAGFIFLLYGGKLLVKSGVALAERFRISPLVVGLTVVSFGTSAPELFVSVMAGIQGHPDVAIGNVIGSNIANITLVLALTAIVIPIPVRSSSVKIDAPFMILVSFLLWLFVFNLHLSRLEGMLFLLLIAIYGTAIFHWSRKKNSARSNQEQGVQLSVGKVILLFVLAVLGLVAGSELLVRSASSIALELGLGERVIAVTMVAFGTSLPELVTSLVAAFKKEMDISIGNIIGSNIFNILVVLGIASVVNPLEIDKGFLHQDIFWMLGTSTALFFFILPFKGGKLTRWKGVVLFCTYCIYVYILYFR
jgi:cation:H+ antiporter